MSKSVIAVINDDPDYLEMMEFMLEQERNCQVVIGQKGKDALQVIKSVSPDLVILDVIMEHEPRGVEILETIRSDVDVRDVPVIICTANTVFLQENAAKLRCLESESLEKPFDLEDLLALIDRQLK